MEARFGWDFARVRVHADGESVKSAGALNATAYTWGRDIVFGEAQYAPGTLAGRRLLAHELAHVVQQSAQPSQSGPAMLGPEHDPLEQQAQRWSDAVAPVHGSVAGGREGLQIARGGAGVGRIQRDAGTSPAPAARTTSVQDNIRLAWVVSGGDPLGAFGFLASLRNDKTHPEQCSDPKLAAAEHYWFAYHLESDTWIPYVILENMVVDYALLKKYVWVPQEGNCKPTPSTAEQLYWGFLGLQDAHDKKPMRALSYPDLFP